MINKVFSYKKLSSDIIEIKDNRNGSATIIDLEQARTSLKKISEQNFATNSAYRMEREKWLGAIRILETR